MGYDIFFDLVKDGDIDPNEAFKQNVENFLYDLSLGFISRYYDKHQEIRDKYITDLFTEIKNLIDKNNTVINFKEKNLYYVPIIEKKLYYDFIIKKICA